MIGSLSGLPAAPGIYALVNMRNGKQYVGSTLDLRRRVKKHFHQLRTGTHWNTPLMNAFVRDGEGAFRVDVLALVGAAEDMTAAEQWFIDRERAADRKHGYNLSPTAGRPTHTAETRARISAAQKGRKLSEAHKAAIRAYCDTPDAKAHLARLQEARKGAKHTPEAREKIRQANLRREPRKLSQAEVDRFTEWRRSTPITDEQRAKMSAAKKGKPGRKLQPHEIEALRQRNASRRGKPSGRTMPPEQIEKMMATRIARGSCNAPKES